MKFYKCNCNDSQHQAFLLRRLLFLRYGRSDPAKKPKPPALLSLATVAQILGISLNRVAWLDRTYFSDNEAVRRSIRPPTMNTMPGEGLATVVSEDNVTDSELQYLLDEETLRLWAPLTLPERCVRFHRRFPDRILRPKLLGKLMRQAGCKKKKIIV